MTVYRSSNESTLVYKLHNYRVYMNVYEHTSSIIINEISGNALEITPLVTCVVALPTLLPTYNSIYG